MLGVKEGAKKYGREAETGSTRTWLLAIYQGNRIGPKKGAETGSTRIWQLAIYQGNRIGPKSKGPRLVAHVYGSLPYTKETA